MKNYVQKAREILASKINVEQDLLDLYTLLVLTKGESCLLVDVHDAWAVWRNKTVPEHRSLIPFRDLSPEVQELDREYMVAIQETAKHYPFV